ncbi:hypothetical protein BOO69_07890 [Sulfitobacter alexandrii]|uniref:HupE/UreJ family protein n=1 Tax=Sulfitobacter alexandrii TaxID=1917485 RepID=A0A1J0WGA4_9RHOB|nr:HupE/UreJ family protein [Sulfitobacter alexandrii]APE43345.1 hypothetical protein BOO69_07890 [Sulfitobacter alexandrii]
MRNTLTRMLFKLAALVLLSSGLAVFGMRAGAHELQPTIADLTVTGDRADLVLRINLDAFLAGIDLDGMDDTDNAENAESYDALRALPPEQIVTRLPALLERWNALPLLSADGAPVPLRSARVDLQDDIGPEFARLADWTLRGSVDPRAEVVQVTWPDGGGALVLRQQGVEEPFTGYLDGGETSPEIALQGGAEQSGLGTFVGYIPVGFDHILPKGLDHILFVLGLFLLSTQLRPLVWQVSAFTLAHTVTLALGALGLVRVPAEIVEPLIAASIVYVAVENIFFHRLSRWRPLVIFGFGLLHGLGFASVLGEFGLPPGQFLPALIGFNVGVELGQLAVIALAALLLWGAVLAARRAHLEGQEELVTEYTVMFRAVSVTGSLIIALIGAYWVVERVFL